MEPETVHTHTGGLRPGSAVRWYASAFAVAVAGAVLGHLAWAEAPIFTDNATDLQRQSAAVPWIAAQRVLHELNSVELFQHFNVPVKALALFLAWLVTVLGGGLALVRPILQSNRRVNPTEEAVFGYAAGFLLVGILILVCGLSGLLHPLFLLFLLVAGFLFGGWNLATWFRQCRHQRPQRAGLSWWLVAPVGLIGVVAFLCTWTPPVQSDAMRYHLAAVQEFVKLGRIAYLPYNAFSNFPFLVEMHYLLAVGLDCPEASQMMHFSLLVAATGAVAALGRRIVRRATPLAAFAGSLYFLVPAGLVVATWANVDHAATLYVLTSTHALLLLRDRPSLGQWTLLGVTCAGCLGVKYTLGPHVALVGAAALLCAFHGRRRWGAAPAVTLGASVALLIVLVLGGAWFAKNYALTGNPAYPLADSIFGPSQWSSDNAELYASKAAEKGREKTVGNLLTAPYDATFRWNVYETHNAGAAPLAGAILLLGLVGISLVSWRRTAASLPLIIVLAAAQALVWFFTYQSNRMLFPFIGLVLAGLPAMLVLARPLARKVAVVVLFGGGLYGGFWALQWMYVITGLSPTPLPYLLGGMSTYQYKTESLNYWRAFDYLNRRAKPGEKVLLVGEHRIYGATFQGVWSDWFDTPAVAVLLRDHGVTSLDELVEVLQRERIKWVMINNAELAPQLDDYFRPRFSPLEWSIVAELIGGTHPRFERRPFPPDSLVLRLRDTESTLARQSPRNPAQ